MAKHIADVINHSWILELHYYDNKPTSNNVVHQRKFPYTVKCKPITEFYQRL